MAPRKMSIVVWVLSAVLASACSSDSTEEPKRRESEQPTAAVDAPLPTADNPPYEIISRDRSRNMRCSFTVRLEERVPESSIEILPRKSRGAKPKNARGHSSCTFCQGWKSMLAPGLRVTSPQISKFRILGMTVEQANSVPPAPDGEVVGRWHDSSPPGRVLTVVRRDDQLIERWDYADGSNSEDSLEESQLPDGRLRLEDQGGNANGDYYVVETDGRLGLYDGDGRWSLLQRESP